MPLWLRFQEESSDNCEYRCQVYEYGFQCIPEIVLGVCRQSIRYMEFRRPERDGSSTGICFFIDENCMKAKGIVRKNDIVIDEISQEKIENKHRESFKSFLKDTLFLQKYARSFIELEPALEQELETFLRGMGIFK